MVRVWSGISASELDDIHLLAEHADLHLILSVITNRKKGYSKHPEVIRFHGKLGYIYKRHEQDVKEMEKRGLNHKSPIKKEMIPSNDLWDVKFTLNDFEKDKKDLERRKKELAFKKQQKKRYIQKKLGFNK